MHGAQRLECFESTAWNWYYTFFKINFGKWAPLDDCDGTKKVEAEREINAILTKHQWWWYQHHWKQSRLLQLERNYRRHISMRARFRCVENVGWYHLRCKVITSLIRRERHWWYQLWYVFWCSWHLVRWFCQKVNDWHWNCQLSIQAVKTWKIFSTVISILSQLWPTFDQMIKALKKSCKYEHLFTKNRHEFLIKYEQYSLLNLKTGMIPSLFMN